MNSNTVVIGTGNIKILILSGWMGDYTVFSPTMSLWDKSKYSIAFMDYRGYGLAKEKSGDFSLDEIAKDAINYVDGFGWDKFHVIGHSMGGMVMQKLALLSPKRVLSAVGIAPVPASGFPMDESSRSLFHGAVDNLENRKQILDFTTGHQNDETWLNKMVKNSEETTTKEAYKNYLTAWSETDFSSEVKKIKIPFLILIGKHDLAITNEFMKNTYSTWLENCDIKSIDKCGHYPMQENPEALVSEIQKFIN